MAEESQIRTEEFKNTYLSHLFPCPMLRKRRPAYEGGGKHKTLSPYLGENLVDTGSIKFIEIAQILYDTYFRGLLEGVPGDADRVEDHPAFTEYRVGRSRLSRDNKVIQRIADNMKCGGKRHYCRTNCRTVSSDMCENLSRNLVGDIGFISFLVNNPDVEITFRITGRGDEIKRMGRPPFDIRRTCFVNPTNNSQIVNNPNGVFVHGCIGDRKVFRCWGAIHKYHAAFNNVYNSGTKMGGIPPLSTKFLKGLKESVNRNHLLLSAYLSKEFDLEFMRRRDAIEFDADFLGKPSSSTVYCNSQAALFYNDQEATC